MQYEKDLLVVVVMYPPHDRLSSIIIQEVKAETDRMCAPGRARLSSGTGCINLFIDNFRGLLTRLTNGIRNDCGLFSHEGEKSSIVPGVVETGFSDPLKKSRRDFLLWLDDFKVIGI
jgi:hypothetical protein